MKTEEKEQTEKNKDKNSAFGKWQKIEREIRRIFQKTETRIFIVTLIGVLFLWGGFILERRNEIQEIPDWAEAGPTIAIACDRPLRGASVSCDTNWEGKTVIRIIGTAIEDIFPELSKQENDAVEDTERTENFDETDGSADELDEYHIWVYLLSKKNQVEWNIDGRIGDVENYKVDISSDKGNYNVWESDELQGVDAITVFKITFGNGHINMAEIEISEPESHILHRSNGICRVVLPRIKPWFGGTRDDLQRMIRDFDYFVNYEGAGIDEQDMLKLSINGEPMYYMMLKIDASYTSTSVLWHPELELTLVSPESIGGYPLIRWSEYDHLYPIVQFKDTEWENKVQRDNLLSGIFVGLGISILFMIPGFLIRKKKEG